MMRNLILLCFSVEIFFNTLAAESDKHREKRNCGSCGGGGGGGGNGMGGEGNGNGHGYPNQHVKTDAAGLSLRDLLQILPYLSNVNTAPVAGSAIIHSPLPPTGPLGIGPLGPGPMGGPMGPGPMGPGPMGGPMGPGPMGPPLGPGLVSAGPMNLMGPNSLGPLPPPNQDPVGAISQLSKVLTRRQIDQSAAKLQFAKVVTTASKAVSEALQRNNRTQNNRASNKSSSPNASKNGPIDHYELEDYGPPPPPQRLSKYSAKGHLGSNCQKDDDCVRGATCQTSGKSSGPKVCSCRPPFVQHKAWCIQPSSQAPNS